jgi:hypothetical protein
MGASRIKNILTNIWIVLPNEPSQYKGTDTMGFEHCSDVFFPMGWVIWDEEF